MCVTLTTLRPSIPHSHAIRVLTVDRHSNMQPFIVVQLVGVDGSQHALDMLDRNYGFQVRIYYVLIAFAFTSRLLFV